MYKVNDMKIIQIDLLNWLKIDISKKNKIVFQEISKDFIKKTIFHEFNLIIYKQNVLIYLQQII